MAAATIGTAKAFWQRLRALLEVATSLAIIGTAAVLVFQYIGPRRVSSKGGDLAVPTDPVALDGAILIGNSDASVVMLEFSDFECPSCGKYSTAILPVLKKEYIDTGRLLWAFRNLPIRIHANAQAAALAATCVAQQGKFLLFHDLLFANQRRLDSQSLNDHAVSLGIDPTLYKRCLERDAPDRVEKDLQLATMLGVTGTPSFFVGTARPGRHLTVKTTIKGTKPLREFVSAIEEALASVASTRR